MWSDTVRALVNGVLWRFGDSAGPNDIAHFDVWLVREVMWWAVACILATFLFRLLWDSRALREAANLWRTLRQPA
jgi:hypothetical protein